MEHNYDIDSIIGLYLSGEADDQTVAQLNRWLDETPENKIYFQKVQAYWQNTELKVEPLHPELAYQKLKLRLSGEEKPGGRVVSLPSNLHNKNEKWYRYVGVAVVLLVCLGSALYFWSRPQEVLVEQEEIIPLLTKENPLGRKSMITLPDSSVVWLNASSKLTFPQKFVNNERIVQLEGEAFFEVAKDSLRPFIVKAGGVQSRVLGTSFNVRAYPGEHEVSVAVCTGKVEVSPADIAMEDSFVLMPAEMASYHKTRLIAQKSSFDLEMITGWKDGIIQFREATFYEVVEQLERWYGVEFVIYRKAPIKKGFNGRFKNQSLEVVLEGIGFASDFSYQIKGNKVIIR
ncbi:FecR domain-containing protein [Rapidithrix thailandica]|uniref:FecR domain-containing protein n=1 Tax=Rapidithrix thailandica TaxID=413964 RepID=A0AAW9SD98_9BACT